MRYGAFVATVESRSGVTRGAFPATALSLVQSWRVLHLDARLANWERAQAHRREATDEDRRDYAPCRAVITLLIPPRTLKSPTTVIRRGAHAATRSSRIRFTTRS